MKEKSLWSSSTAKANRGGEGSPDKQGQDLHPKWIEAASAGV